MSYCVASRTHRRRSGPGPLPPLQCLHLRPIPNRTPAHSRPAARAIAHWPHPGSSAPSDCPSYDSGANRATHNPILPLPLPTSVIAKFSRAARPRQHCREDGPHTAQASRHPQPRPYRRCRQATQLAQSLLSGPRILPRRPPAGPPVSIRPLDADCRPHTQLRGPHATADPIAGDRPSATVGQRGSYHGRPRR